jgi:hypothetical protein
MVMIILAAIKAEGKDEFDTAMPHISNTLLLTSILSRTDQPVSVEGKVDNSHRFCGKPSIS